MKWWQQAVFYQIYPRSFADGNGDGYGDIAGVRNRLHYLSQLGVDALWLSAFLRSPQVDHGYDVSDYCDIDPMFGNLADFDRMLKEAHALGIRITIDLVPNHCSSEHPWFQAALAAGRGSPERERFLFRDGAGSDGATAPTEVDSIFGGPAWTRTYQADGQPDQWYFHLFDPSQPDFNWRNEEVCDEFKRILRFWLDRGVDGFRIDVGDALIKHPLLRADDPNTPLILKGANSEVHAIYRQFRAVMDEYDGDRMAVLEMGDDRDVLMQFVRPDEMHLYFNFPFMHPRAWEDDTALRQSIDQGLWMRGATGTVPTWVTDNHDSPRSVTRYALDLGRTTNDMRGDGSSTEHPPAPAATPSPNLELGTRRARAMAFVLLSLPGTAYIYNGQELGLPNVDDLPEAALQDPVWERSGHTDRGRDGCRIPLPWSGDAPPFGFSSKAGQPWLPQPREWVTLIAAAQDSDPTSMLGLYRKLISMRRKHPALRTGALTWLPGPARVLAFERIALRDEHPDAAVIQVWLNLSQESVALPAGEVLASSVPLETIASGTVSSGATAPGTTAPGINATATNAAGINATATNAAGMNATGINATQTPRMSTMPLNTGGLPTEETAAGHKPTRYLPQDAAAWVRTR